MKPPSAAVAPVLTFAWERQRWFLSFLPGFFLVSLVCHVATFFLFRVVYPQRVTIPQPAPRVTLVTAGTPENDALLQWMDAEDPALLAAGAAATPSQLIDIPYRSSFETIRTAPRTISERVESVQFPPAKTPLAIIRSAAAAQLPPPVAIKPQQTRITWSGRLESRANGPGVLRDFPVKSPAVLAPARFLVGVSADGEVRYVFPQVSSADNSTSAEDLASGIFAKIDKEAAAQLKRARLAPGGQPTEWGWATFYWGDDVYVPSSPARGGPPILPAP